MFVYLKNSIKPRPCENSLADFCTSAILKAWPFAFFGLKEVQKSTREFQHGLAYSKYIAETIVGNSQINDFIFLFKCNKETSTIWKVEIVPQHCTVMPLGSWSF